MDSVSWYETKVRSTDLTVATEQWIRLNKSIYATNGANSEKFAKLICAGRMKLECLKRLNEWGRMNNERVIKKQADFRGAPELSRKYMQCIKQSKPWFDTCVGKIFKTEKVQRTEIRITE